MILEILVPEKEQILNQTLAAANLGKIDMGKGTTKGGYLQRFEARRKAMAKDEEFSYLTIRQNLM